MSVMKRVPFYSKMEYLMPTAVLEAAYMIFFQENYLFYHKCYIPITSSNQAVVTSFNICSILLCYQEHERCDVL